MNKGALLNSMVLGLLAATFAAGTLWSFSASGEEDAAAWQMVGDMVFDTPVTSTVVSSARLGGRDSVSLLSGTQATLHYDAAADTVTVDLLDGGVVFSTLADDFQVIVNTPFARVESQHSTAYLSLEEGQLQIYAVTHPS